MSGIFAKPESAPKSGILFLHGLEGSSTGSKATHLKNRWDAACPSLRTDLMRQLSSSKGNKPWTDLEDNDIEFALKSAYEDAVSAVRYCSPNIILGSSMGGAILYKMICEEVVNTKETFCVFLAPAIHELTHRDNAIPDIKNSFWVFGESDTIISKSENLKIAIKSGGNVIFSPNDNHRLSKALETGIIDASIVSSLELSQAL